MHAAITSPSGFRNVLEGTTTSTGDNLCQMSMDAKLLIVFLRHGGCTFCREALDDLRRRRTMIEEKGTRIVLVHMMEDEKAVDLFSRYGLDDVARISDPDRNLYDSFGLRQGSLSQLLNWKVWWRGFVAGVVNRHGAGQLMGDGRQMPGVFLVENGDIIRAFRHNSAADRPDYEDVAGCALR